MATAAHPTRSCRRVAVLPVQAIATATRHVRLAVWSASVPGAQQPCQPFNAVLGAVLAAILKPHFREIPTGIVDQTVCRLVLRFL